MPYSSQYGAQSLDDAWYSVHIGRQKEVIKLGTLPFLVMEKRLKIPGESLVFTSYYKAKEVVS